MKKPIVILAACAAWFGAAAAVPTSGHAAEITIVRGTTVEIFDTAKAPAGNVYMIKPENKTARQKPATGKSRPASRSKAKYAIYAGDTLWIRNRRTGRLVACFTGSSGKVGKSVIRCTGR